jgi:hypothetical protein
MARDLYDIWEDPDSPNPQAIWRAQLANYVGGFASRESVERFVETTKKFREKEGLK